MKFLNAKQWSKKTSVLGVAIPKGVLYFLGLIFTLTIVLWVVGFAYRSGMYGPDMARHMSGNSILAPMVAEMGGKGGGTGGGTGWSSATNSIAPGMPPMMDASYDSYGESDSMIAPYPMPQYTSGNDAENFEVKEYQANIRVGESDSACNSIAALKDRADIIFESSNESDYGCDFRFKTTKDAAPGVLSLLQSYNPEYLNANTATIKGTLDNIADAEDILKKKLDAIDTTLAQAEKAYDELAQTAGENNDSKTLATVIQNKLALIERMTNERIAINQQLDMLHTQNVDQRDRLDYVFFTISVYEDKIFDVKRIGDEWRAAAMKFVTEINALLVGFSLGLLYNALLALQLVVYLFLILVLVKYSWRLAKHFWNQ